VEKLLLHPKQGVVKARTKQAKKQEQQGRVVPCTTHTLTEMWILRMMTKGGLQAMMPKKIGR
jgi:hypothetical protein